MSDKLTRSQVAERLGLSVPSVRRLEGRALHPVLDDRGRHLHDPAEVDRYAATRRTRAGGRQRRGLDAGEIAARAFELFDQGVSMRECVKRLRQEPETLFALWKQHQRGDFPAWVRHENEERDKAQQEGDARRHQEEWDRQMKEANENNRRLIEASTRPLRTKR